MISDSLISLRAPEPDDVDAMYRMENDPAIWADGRSRAPVSRQLLWDYCTNYNPDLFAVGQLRMMVIDRASGEAAGMIDLYDADAINRRAGIGVIIDTTFRGKGYGAASLALLTHYAASQLGLHQLWAIAAAANEPSRRLFEAAGFCVSGRLRSWVRVGRNYGDAFIYQRIIDPLL